VTQPPFDMKKMMQQAQQLQARMRQVQEELKHRTVEVTVGGGMVRAKLNGQLELVQLEIDPQAVDRRDVEMLQDLVIAAVNQGMKRAQELMQEELSKVTGTQLFNPFGQGSSDP
jgi:DNA-binding YbaB/EbfC family protein